MSKRISELRSKDDIEGYIYLVKYMAVQTGKDGKSYINIILSDDTGDLESRIWNPSDEQQNELQKGDFVKVSGKVNFYQGRLQLIVKDITKAQEGEYDPSQFVPKSDRNPDEMMDRLHSIVRSLEDVYIRDLLTSILSDPEISRRLKTWQAGKSIHHAYQSGLLEHTLSCTELAVTLSPRYNVNANYVVAGAILHDLCKIYELTSGLAVDYTEEGKLVGHIVKCIELIDRFSYRMKHFPNSIRLHLKHIILAHHGEMSMGAPKEPHTAEAMLVHMIDLIDSRMNAYETAKTMDKTPGHWSGMIKHLDRMVYKGELPTYRDYETVDEESEKKPTPPPPSVAPKRNDSKELKQNLGAILLKKTHHED